MTSIGLSHAKSRNFSTDASDAECVTLRGSLLCSALWGVARGIGTSSFRLFAAMFFATVIFLFTAGVALSDCVEDREATLVDRDALREITPCNLLVEAYRGGFGIGPGSFKKYSGTSLESFRYYLPIRMFLFRDATNSSGTFKKEFGYLLSALTYLSGDDLERISLYKTFILGEFWEHNYYPEGDPGFWVTQAIQEHISATSITDWKSVKCFVLADMPTLSVSDVIQTSAFKECAK
ncbi:hypothetical protein [Falsihalocynthiibacter arcticus]|uniref:Uncharacterized protein n=1 Tax=Falsihalocynthiibacter arcticus TaxID=1579316 RepID=A0A126V0W7_9RHOB|nr:hypothetical protein [Falsihalocynthiibacter arcticus]AML51797.1 hypothetical protein RC74_11430 [Falsihalocynthiibacter arcticus]